MKKSLLIIFLVLLADQALKIWVKTNMVLGDSIRIAGDWFYLAFVENNGMAFGIELGGEYGKLLLTTFRIVVVGVMTYYFFRELRKKALHPGLETAFALILAGAIGNIIDCLFYGVIFDDSMIQVATLFPEGGGYGTFLHGLVVDMFYFPIIEADFPEWLPLWGGEHFIFFSPVFNLADTSISTGVGVFILYQKHFFKEGRS